MLNFTVGPVMSPAEVLSTSSQDSPYFRTPEFSAIMLQNEQMVLNLLHSPEESRCVFLTASGTGAMEATIMNVIRPRERVAVINGGSFGQRFVDLCHLHGHEVDEVKLQFGCQVSKRDLDKTVNSNARALLVNMNETSSGLLYDMFEIADFCRRRGLILVIDAISAFIADDLDMDALGADVVLVGSQKALACHPGVSLIALSPRAQDRVANNPEACMYLSLKRALRDGTRGQTPWTPAVTTLLEINERLKGIARRGIDAERAEIASRAHAVRKVLGGTSLQLVAERPSNAVSAYRCPAHNAKAIVEHAKTEHGIWLCPNGGAFADEVFRIGHIGNVSIEANTALISALQLMASKDFFRGDD